MNAMDKSTDAEIDAGGKALREFQMSDRFTVKWEKLPNSQKRKWLFAAAKVLEAAHEMASRGDPR